jgi:hypothetical protein
MSFTDLLGLRIVAPPKDFLKDVKGGCQWFSLKAFLQLQIDWRGKVGVEAQKIIGQGCVGICKASMGDVSKSQYPEDKDRSDKSKFQCWAGPPGERLADAAARKNCTLTPPLIYSKRGKWDPNLKSIPKDGEAAEPNSIVALDGAGYYDYVTRLGNFYLDAASDMWKDANRMKTDAALGKGPKLDDLDMDKPDMIRICRGVPSRDTYPAEIWCYRCCGRSQGGYIDGYNPPN